MADFLVDVSVYCVEDSNQSAFSGGCGEAVAILGELHGGKSILVSPKRKVLTLVVVSNFDTANLSIWGR